MPARCFVIRHIQCLYTGWKNEVRFVWIGEAFVLSQVSSAAAERPGAPMLLVGNEFSGPSGMEIYSTRKDENRLGCSPQGLKPDSFVALVGTTEVVPCYKAFQRSLFPRQSCMVVGATQGREDDISVGDGVELSQVSKSRPGAPMFVLCDDF
jgi:hypothetical protein